MGQEYHVIRYEPEFKSQVAHLQTHLWSPDVERNAAYFDWKYERNPYTNHPLVYLALHGDKVVGMRGMFGAAWTVANKRFKVPCACDLVVTPDHRNQGLFTSIMEYALEDLAQAGFRYVFNLSGGSPVTHLASLGLGWKGIGPLETMRRSPRQQVASAAVRDLAKSIGPLATGYRWIKNRVGALMRRRSSGFEGVDTAAHRRPRTGLRVERLPKPREMAALVNRTATDGRIRHVRNATYFGWRFENPLAYYRFLYAGEDELQGYIVLATSAITANQRHVISIVDLEAADDDTRAALLDAVVDWGGLNSLNVWSATLPIGLKEQLTARGFQVVEEQVSMTQPQRTVLVGPVGGTKGWQLGGKPLPEMSSWDLKMIYSDGI